MLCEAGTFCASGSGSPAGVSVGHYTVNRTSGLPLREGASGEAACPPGFYCLGGELTECRESGTYCPAKSTIPVGCPAGFYCPTTDARRECGAGSYCHAGSTAEAGCEAGYFCSSPASKERCQPGNYCPARSALPQGASAGHYTVDAQNHPVGEQAVAQQPCPLGAYCVNGTLWPCEREGTFCKARSVEPLLCAAGFYCSSPTSQIQCPVKAYCPEGTSTPRSCEKGHFCSSPASRAICPQGSFCPPNSDLPTILTSGHYAVTLGGDPHVLCPGGDDGRPSVGWTVSSNYTCTGGDAERLCPAGFVCKDGVVSACGIGQYCDEGSSFAAVCLAGSYCPLPSEQRLCTRGSYCPAGSSAERACPKGATCLYPGQPELVIFPRALLELRENALEWEASGGVVGGGEPAAAPAPAPAPGAELASSSSSSSSSSSRRPPPPPLSDVKYVPFHYSLSLSSRPPAFVNVTVRMDVRYGSGSGACSGTVAGANTTGGGFQLLTETLVFHPDEYNVPQNVTVLTPVDSVFTGNKVRCRFARCCGWKEGGRVGGRVCDGLRVPV
jgi:hypothetical protein